VARRCRRKKSSGESEEEPITFPTCVWEVCVRVCGRVLEGSVCVCVFVRGVCVCLYVCVRRRDTHTRTHVMHEQTNKRPNARTVKKKGETRERINAHTHKRTRMQCMYVCTYVCTYRCTPVRMNKQINKRATNAQTHRHEEGRDAEGGHVRVDQFPPPLHIRGVHRPSPTQRLQLRHQVDRLVLLVQIRELAPVRLGAHLVLFCFGGVVYVCMLCMLCV
jgi:hypothetical protein